MGNIERGAPANSRPAAEDHAGAQRSPNASIASYGAQVAAGWRELSQAQKGASKSAPAYSRYVNRKIGRLFAALAVPLGISPNQITMLSALFTAAGILLIALAPMGLAVGIAAAVLLALGYALDSSDGQIARLQRSGSLAGEWLDHCVDAVKTSALPLAVAVGLYRSQIQPEWYLLVPLAACVIGASTFFLMILTEQFRLRLGVKGVTADNGAKPSIVRGLLVLPMDYGVMCWVFVLWGIPQVFLPVYALITLGAAGFLVLAMRKWFKEITALVRASKDAS
ncbi:CDP-alcohol phosphatidyltransferase family protein [Glutamicibacter protophormiae]